MAWDAAQVANTAAVTQGTSITNINTDLGNAATTVGGHTTQIQALESKRDQLKRRCDLLEAAVKSMQNAVLALQNSAQTSSSSTTQASSTAKDPKMPTPSKYKGRRGQPYETFVSTLGLMFSGMPITYGTTIQPKNRERVLYALGCLEDDAATWAKPYLDSLQPGATPDPLIDNYYGFMKELDRAFGDVTKPIKARQKLKTIKQNNRPVTTYISEFRVLAAEADYKDFVNLRELFEAGLDVDIIKFMPTLGEPKDIEDFYKKAITADQTLYRVKITTQGHTPKPTPPAPRPPRPSNPTPSTPRPNPPAPTSSSAPAKPFPPPPPPQVPSDMMELDATTGRYHLKAEEKERRFKNNLCMRCGDSGHRAAACDKGKKKASNLAVLEAGEDDDDESQSGKA